MSDISLNPLEMTIPRTVVEEKKESFRNHPIIEKIEKGVEVTFTWIKTEWSVINESRKQIGRIYKITVTYVPEIASKLNKVIASLGILAGIDILFTLINYPAKWADFLKNIGLQDIEGTILSGLASFIITPADALSSLSTFISSLADLGAFPTITFFGLIAQPLALIMLSYSVLRGIYDIIWLAINWIKMPSEIVSNAGLEELRSYLSDQLDIKEEKIEEIEKKYSALKQTEREEMVKQVSVKKIHILSRHTDKKIVTIMTNLQNHLKSNATDQETANKALSDLRTLYGRKIAVNCFNVATSIALETSIVVGMVFQISPIVIPILGLVKGGTLTAKTYYERYGFDRDLKCPDFLKVPA